MLGNNYLIKRPSQKYKSILERKEDWKAMIRKMPQPMIRCMDCGRYFWHDHTNFQRHILEEHVKDKPSLRDRGWRFVPGTGRNKRVI